MSATPRDLLKPRQQRVSEVYSLLQLQAGQANSQFVSFGCVLAPGGTNTQLAISAGEYVLGQSVINFPAVTGQAITTAPTLTSGQSVYVLVEADTTQPTPALTLTNGVVVTSGTPVLPQPNPARIALGYLSLTGAFTPGTTPLTTPMCVTLSYSAGNVNPAGTQSTTGSSGGF